MQPKKAPNYEYSLGCPWCGERFLSVINGLGALRLLHQHAAIHSHKKVPAVGSREGDGIADRFGV